MQPFTLEDCERLLRLEKGRVTGFRLEPFEGDKLGYFSDHHSLIIALDDGEERRFFVKSFPERAHDALATYLRQADVFGKERFFYDTFLALVSTLAGYEGGFAPKPYHHRENKVVVLQDLRLEGYRACGGEALDLGHVKLMLGALAKLHAASVAYELRQTRRLGKRYSLLDEYGAGLRDAINVKEVGFAGYDYLRAAHQGLYALVDLAHAQGEAFGLGPRDFKASLAACFEDIFAKLRPAAQGLNVLCHGDPWPNNAMFRYEGAKPVACKLVDYQLIRYGPPAHDVVFLILNATDEATRLRHYQSLLLDYHSRLRAELRGYGLEIDDILSEGDFLASCRGVFAPLRLKLAYQALLRGAGAGYMAGVYADPEVYRRVLFEDRTEMVSWLYPSDAAYRALALETLRGVCDALVDGVVTREDCWVVASKELGSVDVEIRGYALVGFEDKCGFLGDYYTLKVQAELGGRARDLSCFVKVLPFVRSQRDFVVAQGLSAKEVCFYREMLPRLAENGLDIRECFPACHVARADDVIVFEDLASKGYRKVDHRASLTRQATTLALRHLARLHASFLLLEEKITRATGEPYRLPQDYGDALKEAFYAEGAASDEIMASAVRGVETAFELFAPADEAGKRLAANAYAGFRLQVKPSRRFRNTVCHGDLWASNLLYEHDAEGRPLGCKILDFQTYRYAPPAQDVLAFLYLSTDRDFRARHLEGMLDFYYAELAATFAERGFDVGDVVSPEDYRRSLRAYKVFAAVQSNTHFHNVMVTPEELKRLMDDPALSRRVIFEDKSGYVLDVQARDPVYRERLRESVADIRECLAEIHGV